MRRIKPINRNSRVLVVGGAGFLGSAIVHELNNKGIYDIDVVDELGSDSKWKNLRPLRFHSLGTRGQLENKIQHRSQWEYDYAFNFGGISNQNETDMSLLMGDYKFAMELVNKCLDSGTVLIYASTAYTYGDYSMPFSDDEKFLHLLRPLTPHAYSRHLIDRCIFENLPEENKGMVVALKYPDVFGPNEYHKENVNHRSSVFRMLNAGNLIDIPRIRTKNGKYIVPSRDFIYVKDAAKIAVWCAGEKGHDTAGIYNAGTGQSIGLDKYAELIHNEISLKNGSWRIRWVDVNDKTIPTCIDLDMQKLFLAGYDETMYSFKDAVKEYCKYLKGNYCLGEEDAWILAE